MKNIPKSALRLIERTLDSLVPDIETSGIQIRRIENEVYELLGEINEKAKQTSYIKLANEFEVMSKTYKKFSQGYQTFRDISVGLALLANQPEDGKYYPLALKH